MRTGKASPALVENIDVEAYGANMKLKQLALITTPEPRLLGHPAVRSAATVKDIERGLKESKIGITPLVDGKLIRLPIPELSEERRRDLAKRVREMAEEAKVRIRGHRRDGIDAARKVKKDGDMTEDQLADFEDGIQKITDQYIKSLDTHLENKVADIMRV